MLLMSTTCKQKIGPQCGHQQAEQFLALFWKKKGQQHTECKHTSGVPRGKTVRSMQPNAFHNVKVLQVFKKYNRPGYISPQQTFSDLSQDAGKSSRYGGGQSDSKLPKGGQQNDKKDERKGAGIRKV